MKISFYLLVGLLMVSLGNCLCLKKEHNDTIYKETLFSPPTNKDNLVVIFTTSVQGYLEPCGCTSSPLGGISRLATVVNQASKAFSGRMVFLDAGDLLFESASDPIAADNCVNEARVNLLLSTLSSFPLTATCMGSRDLAKGKDYYQKQVTQYAIPTVNIEGGEGFTQGLLKKAGNITAGITGFVKTEEKGVAPISARLKDQALHLREEGAEVVIALAQAPFSQVYQVVKDIVEIDVVIVGDQPGEQPYPPSRAGERGPFIISAGQQGQYAGVLEFYGIKEKTSASFALDNKQEEIEQRRKLLEKREHIIQKQIIEEKQKDKKQFLQKRLIAIQKETEALKKEALVSTVLSGSYLKSRFIPLSRQIPPDSVVETKVQAFNKQIPGLNAECEGQIVCPKAKAGEAYFVGAETCKQCHEAAFQFWQKAIFEQHFKDQQGKTRLRKVGHAKAWATLEEIEKNQDRNCIGCHSVGFMEPGGYCKIDQVQLFKNVQCEACHGAASRHVNSTLAKDIKRSVPESTCRSCHHVPHIENTQSFAYEEALAKVVGKGHGEALYKRLKHPVQ